MGFHVEPCRPLEVCTERTISLQITVGYEWGPTLNWQEPVPHDASFTMRANWYLQQIPQYNLYNKCCKTPGVFCCIDNEFFSYKELHRNAYSANAKIVVKLGVDCLHASTMAYIIKFTLKSLGYLFYFSLEMVRDSNRTCTFEVMVRAEVLDNDLYGIFEC